MSCRGDAIGKIFLLTTSSVFVAVVVDWDVCIVLMIIVLLLFLLILFGVGSRLGLEWRRRSEC